MTSSLPFPKFPKTISEVLGKAVAQMFPPAQRYLLARHRAIYERPEVGGAQWWDLKELPRHVGCPETTEAIVLLVDGFRNPARKLPGMYETL